MTEFSSITYEVDEAVCVITMDRPEVANAQNTELLDEIDAAFDLADADDDVRVVILAGNGKHWSAGHDLKALVGDVEPDEWRLMRDTPEGKWHHEKVMYFDRCLRIRDFRKPTIAAVQGKCIAAGVMLACMCDLIVASDDASFQNPVLRMTGAGVEILVEPWEMPVRKAKEFLLTAESFSATEAERLGMVNRVVPRADLATAARELAEEHPFHIESIQEDCAAGEYKQSSEVQEGDGRLTPALRTSLRSLFSPGFFGFLWFVSHVRPRPLRTSRRGRGRHRICSRCRKRLGRSVQGGRRSAGPKDQPNTGENQRKRQMRRCARHFRKHFKNVATQDCGDEQSQGDQDDACEVSDPAGRTAAQGVGEDAARIAERHDQPAHEIENRPDSAE